MQKKSFVLLLVFACALVTGFTLSMPPEASASTCESYCQDAWEACYGDCILMYPVGPERRACNMECDYQKENCLASCGW